MEIKIGDKITCSHRDACLYHLIGNCTEFPKEATKEDLENIDDVCCIMNDVYGILEEDYQNLGMFSYDDETYIMSEYDEKNNLFVGVRIDITGELVTRSIERDKVTSYKLQR